MPHPTCRQPVAVGRTGRGEEVCRETLIVIPVIGNRYSVCYRFITAYRLPLTAYHLLLTTYRLLLTAYCLPLTAYHLPLTDSYATTPTPTVLFVCSSMRMNAPF